MPRGIVRFALGALTCAALSLAAGQATAAPQITVPACDGLQTWAATVVVADTYEVAPILKLPKALQDAALRPVFGAPALAWSAEDVRAASGALVRCFAEAKKRRDKPAMDAYGAANAVIAKLLPRMIAALQKAKQDAATLTVAIDALPDSVALDRGLQVLIEADPATPVAAPYQGLPREVVDPLWRLANTVRTLAHEDREALYAGLADRRGTIQASLGEETSASIAAAPVSADGALTLMQIRQDLGKMADGDTRRRLSDSVESRLRDVRAALRAATPPAWSPPDCPDLYRWSGGPNAQSQIEIGPQRTLAAFQDDQVVPVFGVSIADWTDDDVARSKTLRTLCRARWQSLPGANAVNNPSAAAPELLKLASTGRWIEDADSWIASARTALAAYRSARETFAANLERLAALPETPDSLAEIGSLSNSPALNGVGSDERKAFQREAEAKVRTIRTAALRDAAKSLAGMKVEQADDLGRLVSAAGQALAKLPDYESQDTFRNEFQQILQMAAMHVLPDFQAKLDKIPASRDGLMESGSAVSNLTGITGAEDLPAFGGLRTAATARSRAIIEDMRKQNCAALWKELGMGRGDIDEPVWGAGKPTAMGELVCGMAEGGVEINEYNGTGLLSKTATLKVTLPMGGFQTISLHTAEVAANQIMLVGHAMADANQRRDIAVQEWEMLIAMSTGRQIATKQVCDPVMGAPEEQLTAIQRMLSVDCALEILMGRLQ